LPENNSGKSKQPEAKSRILKKQPQARSEAKDGNPNFKTLNPKEIKNHKQQ
jgi:hypothetical protein